MEQTKAARIKELTDKLNEAARAYYQESREIMPNLEYDALYDELAALESETGIVMAGSPTQKVGYELVSELPREQHASPMLSLDKTKNVENLVDWLGDQEGLLSWKMDGLTVVLTYREGKLFKAVTRGNGEIGEVVTPNAKVFDNVPLVIPYTGELVLRGEAVIRYSDFEKINAQISVGEEQYKNPRNLCAGSVRQLDSSVTAKRHVRFYAFSLVSAPGVDFKNSRAEQFEWLRRQGFDVVYYEKVKSLTLPGAVVNFAGMVAGNDLPSDGLVLLMDDIAYGESLGRTAKFPRNSIAFKWADEQKETVLKSIEWSPSRTGLINPVAIFEPVQLEGTTVSRASVHNVSIMEELALGVGDHITVYKANMIIPQIAENLTRTGPDTPPAVCPVCGAPTKIVQNKEAKVLFCPNEKCQAKQIKRFTLFVSRDALNIDGMSEATIEKLIQEGIIGSLADIFRMDDKQDRIAAIDGFGALSASNLVKAADKAADTTLPRLIYGLGIAGVGVTNARAVSRYFGADIEKVRNASKEDLMAVPGIGDVLAGDISAYFADQSRQEELTDLLGVLTIAPPEDTSASEKAGISGKTFVITGTLEKFENRKAAAEMIEAAGGKVTGSVTSKTDYLINNDIQSHSSKNRKAKELGIPIISEEEFLALISQS
ncbi:MAG: NAD-dependent DNA ligase LigA [Lachnospiraceae bacterium]|nr:NAD-dependent DNA ligase LigA [Lachnospiraceae bacterium]